MALRMSRRQMIRTLGVGMLALGASEIGGGGRAQAQGQAGGLPNAAPYELPPLSYDYKALEPTISEQILRVHHDKHHAAYVAGLNKALERLKGNEDAEQITPICRDLAFNGAGHVLHTLYWNSMKAGGGEPGGVLQKAIERDFGQMKTFMTQFANAAKKAEASAWAVLAWEPLGRRLHILQAEKHQNLAIWGVVPVMCCDVWEHAYYLQYQNRRPDYVDAFMKIIDWASTGQRLEAALAQTKA